MTDPFVFYLAAGVAATIVVMVFALLGADEPPPTTPEAEALAKARLDLAAQLNKPLSVIQPRERNGRR